MISPCDGCQRIFSKKLTLLTAKEWKPSICDTPAELAHACANLDCDYNFEHMCIDFQFCDHCLSSRGIINRTFGEFLV